MTKEKVFIVMSHKHSLKKGSTTEWEVTETVEFVSQLRNKHINTSSIIADYINRKIIVGSKFNVTDYDKFEDFVRTKYSEQMAELDAAYNSLRVAAPVPEKNNSITDVFGNVREKTVFDI